MSSHNHGLDIYSKWLVIVMAWIYVNGYSHNHGLHIYSKWLVIIMSWIYVNSYPYS